MSKEALREKMEFEQESGKEGLRHTSLCRKSILGEAPAGAKTGQRADSATGRTAKETKGDETGEGHC